jgi:hypothetical protein
MKTFAIFIILVFALYSTAAKNYKKTLLEELIDLKF